MTYEEVVQRIVLQAQLGNYELKGYDPTALVEAFMPTLMRRVAELFAADERKRPLLRNAELIEVAGGRATLPSNALVKYVEDSTLYDHNNLTKEYSYVKDWATFMSPLDQRLGYYTVRDEADFFQREPGELFDASLNFTGDMTLVIPCIPQLPAAYTDSFFLPTSAHTEVITAIIDHGAKMLRGEA